MNKNQAESKTEIITQWVDLYLNDLTTWAYYKTSDKEVAEDLVQETFLSAFQGFENFENKSNPKTWLISILNFKIIDYYRNKSKIKTKQESDYSIFNDESFLDKFFDENDAWRVSSRPQDWMETENLLDNPDFLEILYICIGYLPQQWNSAIILKYIDNKDGKNICQELGISPSNFWQILHRAKLQLRNCLDNNWFKSEL